MNDVSGILLNLAEQTTSSAASAGSSLSAPEGAEKFLLTLIAMGVCVLVVWMLRRLVKPRKLFLLDTPGRPNDLGVVHILVLVLASLVLGMVGGGAAHAVLGPPPADSAAEVAPGASVTDTVGDEVPLSPKKRHETKLLVLGTAISWPLMIAVALTVAHMTFRHGVARGLGLTPRRWLTDSARGVLSFLAVLPICCLLIWLGRLLLPESVRASHVLLRYLSSPDAVAGWKVLVVILAAVMVPIEEEILFRGILQSALRRWIGRPWPAILLSSGLFALLHLTVQSTPPYVTGCQNVVPLFALSVMMGYSYERTGRLWSSILIHVLFNGVNLILVLWSCA